MYNTARNNQKIIEAYFKEVWNQGKLELLDDLVAPDYINHSPSSPNPRPGPEGLKPIIAEMAKAFLISITKSRTWWSPGKKLLHAF